MGYIRHNAIIVTSWADGAIEAAADFADDLGLQVIGPSEKSMNRYRSLLVCPDGSKEGWEESRRRDSLRLAFRHWLNAQRYEDGSSPFEWVEVAYGSDDANAEIVIHAWDGNGSDQSTEGNAK